MESTLVSWFILSLFTQVTADTYKAIKVSRMGYIRAEKSKIFNNHSREQLKNNIIKQSVPYIATIIPGLNLGLAYININRVINSIFNTKQKDNISREIKLDILNEVYIVKNSTEIEVLGQINNKIEKVETDNVCETVNANIKAKKIDYSIDRPSNEFDDQNYQEKPKTYQKIYTIK